MLSVCGKGQYLHYATESVCVRMVNDFLKHHPEFPQAVCPTSCMHGFWLDITACTILIKLQVRVHLLNESVSICIIVGCVDVHNYEFNY